MERLLEWFLDILAGLVVIMVILLSISVVVGGMLYAIAEYAAKPACYAATAEMGFDVRWQFYGGCLIDVGDKWIPLSNYRYFEE